MGSRAILAHLDTYPGPSLYPRDPDQRRAIEQVETWADGELQAVVRRLAWAILRRAPRHMTSYTAGSRLPVPQIGVRLTAPVFARLGARLTRASDASVHADVRKFNAAVAHADQLIADGLLGNSSPTAADLEVGSSFALAGTFGDLAAFLDAHPTGELAQRLFPRFPGHAPGGVLTAAELSPR
ncbi:MAG: glutathione S-transferase family protein [Solirubrobacteraceae bacterium]